VNNTSIPKLSGIDHCHLNVDNLVGAVKWYERVLGFEGEGRSKGIAFLASGDQFIQWLNHLEGLNVKAVLADHGVTFSMYFKDESGNSHEITSHDYRYIKSYYPNVELGSHSAKKN